MRQFQVILYCLTFSIVLLHSFIPHRHHSGLLAIEHQIEHKEASTIIDLLALAFHNDHQLEEYTSTDDASDSEELKVTHTTPTLLSNTAINFLKFQDLLFAESALIIQKNVVFTHALRGPPAIS